MSGSGCAYCWSYGSTRASPKPPDRACGSGRPRAGAARRVLWDQPGRVSAAARAPFANPRNDFWRLLLAAGFTPRLLEPHEFRQLPAFGVGLTNAATRTTRGSGDLRAADFADTRERLDSIARDLQPKVIAFVGKAAYQGSFRERPEHGLQARRLGETDLFVLPSTSPANAAVSWDERLQWFRALRDFVGA